MASILVDNMSVSFPLYDAWNRSIKQSLMPLSSAQRLFPNQDRIAQIDALSEVSLTLRPGDKLVILGENGSGKTTLLRVLGGLLKPSHGSVNIFGRPATILDLGFGFDLSASAYDTIVLYGILFGKNRGEIRDLVAETIEYSGLADVVGFPIRNLTPGQLFQFSIGIAISLRADILLLDETFDAVGPDFVAKTKASMIDAIGADGIFVIVERSRAILDGLCNMALVLKDGRIEDLGTFDEIMARYGDRFTI